MILKFLGFALLGAVFISQLPSYSGQCYKTVYNREPSLPTDCDSSTDNVLGLCYPKCQSGYKGIGTICRRNCKSGELDLGDFCQRFRRRCFFGRCYNEPSSVYRKNSIIRSPSCGKGKHFEYGSLCFKEKCKPGYDTIGSYCMMSNCNGHHTYRCNVDALCGAVVDHALDYLTGKQFGSSINLINRIRPLKDITSQISNDAPKLCGNTGIMCTEDKEQCDEINKHFTETSVDVALGIAKVMIFPTPQTITGLISDSSSVSSTIINPACADPLNKENKYCGKASFPGECSGEAAVDCGLFCASSQMICIKVSAQISSEVTDLLSDGASIENAVQNDEKLKKAYEALFQRDNNILELFKGTLSWGGQVNTAVLTENGSDMVTLIEGVTSVKFPVCQ